ncbi:MAG: hypothetical protein DCC71_25405, partial [Proteobacteria bacterium]
MRRSLVSAASLALLAVGLLGAAAGTLRSQAEAAPSHDVAIAQLAFCDAAGELHSLDAAGTWKTWDAASGAHRSTWHAPALAGARALALAPGCRRALVTTPAGVRLLDLDAPPERRAGAALEGAAAAAFLDDERIA